jgi:hypothetical protein
MTKNQALVQLGLLVGGACALIFGLVLLKNLSREGVRDQDRFTIAFADIVCEPPPESMDSNTFLAEVQYISGYPDRLALLEENLPSRLAAAFARHPWVERVEQVEILPERRVHVKLVYRVPVLAVVIQDADQKEPTGKVEIPAIPPQSGVRLVSARAVDAHAVLLPATATLAGLPVLVGDFAEPRGAAGTTWGDLAVRSATRTAEFLKPHQARLHLAMFEMNAGSLTLKTLAGSRVLWGRSLGTEQAGEALAAEKLDRLLRYCDKNGSLDQPECCYEHDVRLREKATHERISAGK